MTYNSNSIPKAGSSRLPVRISRAIKRDRDAHSSSIGSCSSLSSLGMFDRLVHGSIKRNQGVSDLDSPLCDSE